ncbi:MAG TPA: hypothetical protein VGG37_08040 [Opitutaceae bacterium]|jgi:hypothetical protein
MGRNRPLAWIGLAVLAAAAAARNLPHLAPGMLNWAEPGNVAAALAGGRGFSDPFDGGTGATAWVSPLPVLVDALVFLVFGTKSHASAVVLLCLCVGALAAANALLDSALRSYGPWMQGAACAAFLGYCVLVPGGPLEVLSEAPLDILLSVVLLWAGLGMGPYPPRRKCAGLLAAAFLAPLENAGVALAVCAALVLLAWRTRQDRGGLALPLAAAAACALAVLGWAARNESALGHPIPNKSNFWFELHLANVDAPEGLPRVENVLRRLPFFDVREFSRYAALGEIRYVDSFRAPAAAAIRANPLHFAGNVLRRAGDALVFCRRDGGAEHTDFHFAVGDWARLVRAGELITTGNGGGVWTRIDAPPFSEKLKLESLGLSDPRGVEADWARCRLSYDQANFGLGGMFLGYATAGIPFAAILISAFLLGGRLPAPGAWAAGISLCMLIPYVLVNHNERHQLPLIAMQAVALGSLAQAVRARLRPSGP